ncbi:MAG: alpha/beta hydrolase family esterase [Chitinophagaceae bacterium]|jgi:polyhydroxybutyrate depolymerase
MRLFLFSWVLIYSLSDGYSQSAAIKKDSIRVDGIDRSFLYKSPASKLKDPSLVFILHGSGGSGEQMLKRAPELMDIADQENFIAVYPSGYLNYWNECRKAANSKANQMNINEEDFFKGMIRYFHQQYNINRRKVFVVGTSGGGHMAYKLALTMPDQIQAITAIIANLPDTNNLDCPEMRKPMNVMIVNGTKDNTNPYDGGEVILGSGNFGFVRSTDRTFAYWSQLSGYTESPRMRVLPDTDPNDGKTIEEYVFSGRNKEVILLKVIGGKHDYPGDINVHLEAWKFFKSTLK